LDDQIDRKRLYDYHFAAVDQADRSAAWAHIAPFIWELMGRPQRVLDPAAGRFEFLNGIGARERFAVDIVDHGHDRHPAITLVVGDSRTVELPGQGFDGIFVSNFLEHLEDKHEVAAFLRRMYDVTAPGGRIAVMGPNFRYCAPSYFDDADHSVALSHESIGAHLHGAGYDVVKVIPRFVPFSFKSRLPSAPWLVEWYLKMPFVWPLLGKQLLLIGKRPD
jgi:ubiquinone/menaquinone biosynthesis C-methylase UbiE